MSIDKSKEAKEFRKLTDLVIDRIRSNPRRSAMALLEDIPSRESHRMAANAVNHFCITLASKIVHRHTGETDTDAAPDPAPDATPAATMLMCAQALNDIMKWAKLNPDDDAALETAMSEFLAEHLLREEDFDQRTPAANFHAAHTASADAATLGLKMNGPSPNTADALLTLVQQAENGEEDQLARAEEGRGLYFNDTHYDHLQTKLWAQTMIRASGAKTLNDT